MECYGVIQANSIQGYYVKKHAPLKEKTTRTGHDERAKKVNEE